MMLRKTIFAMVALLAASLMFMGCPGDDSEPTNENKSGVDFTNYAASSYVIKVRNNTTKALVAFKGSPASANLMGGIPASATNHGLQKNTSLFTNSQDFILFVVTEDDYIANKNNLSNLATTPFARLYAYYNNNAANTILYDISNVLGGTATITLQNNTKYNVELRKDSIYGETIGYTAAGTLNTTFHVDTGDYYLFPVFRKFDKSLGEIVTVYPKDENGYPYIENFNLTDKWELNALDWSTNVTFTSSAAYIYIDNQSSVGISFYEGSNPVATSTGGTIINRTDHLVYEIEMPKIGTGSNASIASSREISGYRVGTAASSAIYITGDATTKKTLEAGKMYTLTVSGDRYYNLSCEFTGTPVDVDPASVEED